MNTILLLIVSFFFISAALAHSWMGERQIIQPFLQGGADPAPRLRLIIRVAWHALSVFSLVFAIVYIGLALTPFDSQGRLVVAIFCASFLVLGAAALLIAGPRHISWPLLLAVSIASGLALL